MNHAISSNMNLISLFMFFQKNNLIYSQNNLFKLALQNTMDEHQIQRWSSDCSEFALTQNAFEHFIKHLSFLNTSLLQFIRNQRSVIEKCEEERQNQIKLGITHTLWGDSNYPKNFESLQDPPLLLSFYGVPIWNLQPHRFFLSVVGSREPTYETQLWIETHLSKTLHMLPTLLISGGARGVDQLCHFLALRHQEPTIAFLPAGLGEIYPSSLRSHVSRISSLQGAVLSEYDFFQKMRKSHFHHRNRLIAAFGAATLVVQAQQKSGSLITANHAAQLSKSVFVVPGHPTNSKYLGGLKLLQEGATIVLDATDLLILCQSESLNQKLNSLDLVANPFF